LVVVTIFGASEFAGTGDLSVVMCIVCGEIQLAARRMSIARIGAKGGIFSGS
jgi:hypothetical protein